MTFKKILLNKNLLLGLCLSKIRSLVEKYGTHIWELPPTSLKVVLEGQKLLLAFQRLSQKRL